MVHTPVLCSCPWPTFFLFLLTPWHVPVPLFSIHALCLQVLFPLSPQTPWHVQLPLFLFVSCVYCKFFFATLALSRSFVPFPFLYSFPFHCRCTMDIFLFPFCLFP